MARYTDSVCRLCRREGAKLFLKGDRCYSSKCAFAKRPVPPGEHGLSRKKQSEYGMQLREKQKVKRAYGMQEKQFKKYFEMAEKSRGITGEVLLSLLERRLDNTVFRLGLADSRAQARQTVLHGHVTVNGKKVNIASYFVEVGDEIKVKDSSKDIERFKEIREGDARSVGKWLTFDNANLTGRVVAVPQRDDIDLTIQEHMIVELYSK
jgi:small subunit ribosomal protein S4